MSAAYYIYIYNRYIYIYVHIIYVYMHTCIHVIFCSTKHVEARLGSFDLVITQEGDVLVLRCQLYRKLEVLRMYIHTRTQHTQIHINIYIHTYVYTYIHTNTHTHTHTHTHTNMYIHKYIHTYIALSTASSPAASGTKASRGHELIASVTLREKEENRRSFRHEAKD